MLLEHTAALKPQKENDIIYEINQLITKINSMDSKSLITTSQKCYHEISQFLNTNKLSKISSLDKFNLLTYGILVILIDTVRDTYNQPTRILDSVLMETEPSSEEDNNELIHQLEEVILKKEERIKMLTKEFEEVVTDSKNMEKIIEELYAQKQRKDQQLQKIKNQLNELKKIQYSDYWKQSIIENNDRKSINKDSYESIESHKKIIEDIFKYTNHINENQEHTSLEYMLFIQSLSIQALLK